MEHLRLLLDLLPLLVGGGGFIAWIRERRLHRRSAAEIEDRIRKAVIEDVDGLRRQLGEIRSELEEERARRRLAEEERHHLAMYVRELVAEINRHRQANGEPAIVDRLPSLLMPGPAIVTPT